MTQPDTLVSFAALKEAVARSAGLTTDDLVGKFGPGRGPRARARRRLMVMTRRLRPDLSMPWLGRALGGRHHTSIFHMLVSGEKQLREDPDEPARIAQILSELGAGDLPELRPHAVRLISLAREIRETEDRLARLRALQAQLEAAN